MRLRVSLGWIWVLRILYQKPYPAEFNFVSFPASWRIAEFTKFNGDDSRTTWEHIVGGMAQPML